jgi:hypothetical protein
MMALFAVGPCLADDSVYSDPDGYYALRVPDKWEIHTQTNGVSLLRGQAYASVLRMKGRGTPGSLIEFFSSRIGSQWKQFDGANYGESGFGGKPGAFAWYTGLNPKGVEAVLKIVATADAESGYAMLMSVPRAEFPAVKADFEEIEKGFTLLK